MRDSKSHTEALFNQIEDCDPVENHTRDKVRRLVAAHAEGLNRHEEVVDAEELMMMLGIHPAQEEDLMYLTVVHDIPASPAGM